MASNSDNSEQLLSLALTKFGRLNEAHRKLFLAVSKGEIADYSSETWKLNDPEHASEWGSKRTLHAEKIVWLCTDPQALALLPPKGLQVKGAKIEGQVDLEFATISVPLSFLNCAFPEPLLLQQATVRGLDLRGTHVVLIHALRLKIETDLLLYEGFKADGLVCLYGAAIGGALLCDDAQFISKDGYALDIEGAKISGSVYLRDGFKVDGGVRLFGATIGSALECDDGQFISKDGYALNVEGAKIGRACLLRNGFKADGGVRLFGATIGGALECDDGQFTSKDGYALDATEAIIEGSCCLRNGFESEGEVRLMGTTIRQILDLHNIKNPKQMMLNLAYAKVNALRDEKKSWPDKTKLYLNCFTYSAISADSPRDYKSRLEWIHLQPPKPFSHQPYEQLAKVMRESGQEQAAKKVLIAKQKDLRRYGDLNFWGKFRNLLFGAVIAHGYRPHQALWYAIGMMVLGAIFFTLGGKSELFSPSRVSAYISTTSYYESRLAENYPEFSPVVYSLDAFIPIINLHQQNYWLPDKNRGEDIKILWIKTWGDLLRHYLWLHISLGWILTSLWVAGFTGLVRKT